MTQDEIENALAQRVAAETGLAAGKVIWADQGRARPARPFIELMWLEEISNQFSEETITDNPAFDPDTDTTNTQAIFLTNTDHPDIRIQLVAFSTDVKGANSATGLLRMLSRKLGSTRAQEALGDIAFVSRGNIRTANVVLDNEFEGRAVLALTFRIADANVEDAGIIETVLVEETIQRTNDTLTKTVTIK